MGTDEAKAIYFNNGDLKFGRDMHCRVTNNTPGAIACYVSNFGDVGHDVASGARAIFDHDGLAKLRREPIEHEPRHHVSRAARAERDGRLDQSRRPVLRVRGRSRK